MDFSKLASPESIEKTLASLKANGIDAHFVQKGEDAKRKLFEIMPRGASVMNMSSVTLDTIGVSGEIMESGKYDAVKKRLMAMDKNTQSRQMREMGAAPDWTVGSVHALTEDGHLMIASLTGSQLPAYAYSGANVIWVVGAQKIVKNIDEGMKRIYEHCLPLESERAKKAYGVSGSSVNKILIINKEVTAGRLTLILVNETLGF